VEGAGGIVSDWKGAPWRDGEPLLAAGDPELHEQTVSLLAQTAAS